MKNQVGFIIVTYNGSSWIKKCLESLFNNAPGSVIIVIDNNSTDSTISILEDFGNKIELIRLNENLGFGKANNIGLSLALERGYEYVYLINQDAYLEPNCIDRLIDVSLKNDEYGVLSPLHINAERTALDRNFSVYLNASGCPNFYADLILPENQKEIYPVEFVNAAGWLITKQCLKRIGGFNPVFPHYGEDVNYTHRLKYHKMKIGVVPDTFMIHDREVRSIGGKGAFDLGTFKKTLLVELSDPNNTVDSLLSVLLKTFSKCWKCIVNPFKLVNRINAYYECAGRTHKNRVTSMTEGPSFLSMDGRMPI